MASLDDTAIKEVSRPPISPTSAVEPEDPVLLSGTSTLGRSEKLRRQLSKPSKSSKRFSWTGIFSSENKDVKERKPNNKELLEQNGLLTSQLHDLQEKYNRLEKEYKTERADRNIIAHEMTRKTKGLEKQLNNQKATLDDIYRLINIFGRKLEDIIPNGMYEAPDINIVIGDHNVIATTNTLLTAATTNLRKTVDDLNDLFEKKERLSMSLELNFQEISSLRGVLNETREELTNLRRILPAGKLHINYVLSLSSDGDIIDRCVDCIRALPEVREDYDFDKMADYEGAQLGVLRIVKKYAGQACGRRMTRQKLSKKLDMPVSKSDTDQSQSFLDKDSCARILVKWVRASPSNTAAELKDILPRTAQYRRVPPPQFEVPTNSVGHSSRWYSLSSILDPSAGADGLTREQAAELMDVNNTLREVRETTDEINTNVKRLMPALDSTS